MVIGVIAIACLALVLKIYLNADWLKPDVSFNQKTINGIILMARSTSFGLIPSLSALLILSSLIIWHAAKDPNDDGRSN